MTYTLNESSAYLGKPDSSCSQCGKCFIRNAVEAMTESLNLQSNIFNKDLSTMPQSTTSDVLIPPPTTPQPQPVPPEQAPIKPQEIPYPQEPIPGEPMKPSPIPPPPIPPQANY